MVSNKKDLSLRAYGLAKPKATPLPVCRQAGVAVEMTTNWIPAFAGMTRPSAY